AMKGILEAQDRGTLGVAAGNLDRVLDCFGSGIHEEGFLRKIAGSNGVHSFRQPYIALIRHDVKAGVQESPQLLLHGVDDFWSAMSSIQASNAAREIDQAIAVDIFDHRSVSLCDEDGGRVEASLRHGGVAALHQLART